jgi:hypothetical protein
VAQEADRKDEDAASSRTALYAIDVRVGIAAGTIIGMSR